MRKLIRRVATLLCLCIMLVCPAYAAKPNLPTSSNIIALTDIQKETASYVAVDEVGAYDHSIITDELIENCSLPKAGAGKVPYWTGYIIENKGSVNSDTDQWDCYAEDYHCIFQEEVRHLHELGFNCVRVIYSLSFLSDPTDINSINLAELRQLDELISWGLQYDVHVMLSIIGLPGKANTSWEEENVGMNDAIFTDDKMTATYQAYMEMLARRYATIPTKALSFELLAEPQPDWSASDPLRDYEDTLAPIAKAMWAYNKDRILIANDAGKMLPARLAKIGCCLSLHDHIYYVDGDRVQEDLGFTPQCHWPMEVLPQTWKKGCKLTLVSEENFHDGVLTICYQYSNKRPTIKADNQTIFKPGKEGQFVYDRGSFNVDIPAGTKKIEIAFTDEFSLDAICLAQNGQQVNILSTAAYSVPITHKKVTIQVNADGTTTNIDNPQLKLDSEYLYQYYIKAFADCAKKNKVSFIMSEIGTDTLSLTPDEYVAYHQTWLDALAAHQISWMYNCYHNICAPIDIMWHNTQDGFRDFREVPSIPNYQENVMITELLRSYQ